MTRPRWALRGAGERGSASIELVLVTPLLLMVLLLVVGLGRMAHARQQIESVAADAARAASLQRNTTQSKAAGKLAAQLSLGDGGLSCSGLLVDVDVSAYQPGGRVVATVTCKAKLGDIALSGLPGARTFTATSVVPIEDFRSR